MTTENTEMQKPKGIRWKDKIAASLGLIVCTSFLGFLGYAAISEEKDKKDEGGNIWPSRIQFIDGNKIETYKDLRKRTIKILGENGGYIQAEDSPYLNQRYIERFETRSLTIKLDETDPLNDLPIRKIRELPDVFEKAMKIREKKFYDSQRTQEEKSRWIN